MEKTVYMVENINDHIPMTWSRDEYECYDILAVFDSKEEAKKTLKSVVSYAVVIKETEDYMKVINPDTDDIQEYRIIDIPLNPSEVDGF